VDGIFYFDAKEEIIIRRKRVGKRKEVDAVDAQLKQTSAEVEKAIHKLENAQVRKALYDRRFMCILCICF
jgi:hypothetical protein